MNPLPDPEAAWEPPPAARDVDRAEVEARIGPTREPLRVLAGGRANLNVRVGEGRVLRIYRRDRSTLARERALLSRAWSSLRVPRVLAAGEDFLVLEHVPHRPLEDTAEHGAAVGRALGEIHRTSYPVAGFLGAELEVAQPLADFPAALAAHADERLSAAALPEAGELRARVGALLGRVLPELRAMASPRLLHGDFKPANLRWAAGGLLVLDWEFAYAGPALMDLGQLTRWDPSEAFRAAVAHAYRGAGGVLPADWLRWAELLDLGNLAGLAATAAPGSRQAEDLVRRIRRTLGVPPAHRDPR